MKIGITCYPTYGGSGVVATELGKCLAKRAHQIHFISYELPFRLLEDSNELIYYHEDGRYELYNIANDVGEQEDLLAAQPERARAMRARLAQWLDATGARFPTEDPQFDSPQRDARWEMLRTSGKERLEKQHARYLDADFTPNKDWWGSALAD